MDARGCAAPTRALTAMTPEEFRVKWRTEREHLSRRHALVDGTALCDEVLEDFRQVVDALEDSTLNLREAALESGYSADYLGGLVRQGTIPNAGRPNAPRVRRRDLPKKATCLPSVDPLPTLGRPTKGQIARAVVTSDDQGGPR